MVFEIKNKVAIITGGASGIGLRYAKELLKNGAKGVTLADVNEELAEKAIKEINEEFGDHKCLFVKTDVTNINEFEDVFVKTIETFKNIDILFNNAGILNDKNWEKGIAINVNGTVHGILLGIDKYLPKYKQGNEALIVNISSITGTRGCSFLPIHCGTKYAILGLTKSWGTAEHYEDTNVRVIAICPGVTKTPLLMEMLGRNLGERYEKIAHHMMDKEAQHTQEPEYLAKEVMEVIKYAPNGTVWVIEASEKAYQYDTPHKPPTRTIFAVTIADIDEEIAERALAEIKEEFGYGKAIFVRTNVANIKEFEGAFIKTIEKFKYVDILFNNAGIMNDATWEKEISININGTINGILLGMERYLLKYRQGNEALIVNISSTLGTKPANYMPIYSGTKHAILGLTTSWGHLDHFEDTKVRVIAICPGMTMTPLLDLFGRFLGSRYEKMFEKFTTHGQDPGFVAKQVMEVIKYAPNGTIWIIQYGEQAFQYDIPDRSTMKDNVLKR